MENQQKIKINKYLVKVIGTSVRGELIGLKKKNKTKGKLN